MVAAAAQIQYKCNVVDTLSLEDLIVSVQDAPNHTLAGLTIVPCAGDAVADLLIANISLTTKRLSLKELPADASQPPSLRVCEAKPGPLLAHFVSVSARCVLQHVFLSLSLS